MPQVLRVDGSLEDLPKKPTLEQLQKAVGGYIEKVRLPHQGQRYMYVNEEGLIHRLPLNPSASNLAQRPLVGDVVVMGRRLK